MNSRTKNTSQSKAKKHERFRQIIPPKTSDDEYIGDIYDRVESGIGKFQEGDSFIACDYFYEKTKDGWKIDRIGTSFYGEQDTHRERKGKKLSQSDIGNIGTEIYRNGELKPSTREEYEESRKKKDEEIRNRKENTSNPNTPYYVTEAAKKARFRDVPLSTSVGYSYDYDKERFESIAEDLEAGCVIDGGGVFAENDGNDEYIVTTMTGEQTTCSSSNLRYTLKKYESLIDRDLTVYTPWQRK